MEICTVTFTLYTEPSVDAQSDWIVSAQSDRISLSARIQNSIITDSQHFDETFLLFMMVDFLLGTSNLHLIGFLTISFLTLILLKFVYGHLLNTPAEYYHGSKQL